MYSIFFEIIYLYLKIVIKLLLSLLLLIKFLLDNFFIIKLIMKSLQFKVKILSRYHYRPVTIIVQFWALRYRPLPFSGQRDIKVTDRYRMLALQALPIVV